MARDVPLCHLELVPAPARDDVGPGPYFLDQLVEPVLRPVRRIIPPVGSLDLSFLVVFLVAQFLLVPVLLR